MDCSGMDNDATCVVNEKYKFVLPYKLQSHLLYYSNSYYILTGYVVNYYYYLFKACME